MGSSAELVGGRWRFCRYCLVEKSVELSASGIDGVLFGLGDARPDERSTVLFDESPNQLVDGQPLEFGIVVAKANQLTTDQPKIVAVAIEGDLGCLA